jgi:RNA polymerase sigma factor (sigma-70 family)
MEPAQRMNVEDSSRLSRDRTLVNSILRGSDTAWQNFLLEYSSLVYHVVRRHMIAEDDDEIRTVYVDILKKLHDGGIRGYENRACLSTWLTVYTRARTFDYLRSRNGRYREPKSVRRLGPLDRRVLQMYYVEKQTLEIVVHTLKWEGYAVDAKVIVDSIQRIESTLDRRYLKRIENESRLTAAGVSSVRMLKYLVCLQTEYSDRTDGTPEKRLIEEENRMIVNRIREAVARLEPTDREIVKLRFEDNLSAARIAEKVGYSKPRKVYSVLERILEALREVVDMRKSGRDGVSPRG